MASSLDGQQSLLDGKAAERTIYRKIGFFIMAFLFSVVNLLSLLFRFLARNFFRINNNRIDSCALESRQLRKMICFDNKIDDFIYEKVERSMPAFSFKHQIQIFDEKISNIEEEEKFYDMETLAASETKNQPDIISADIHNHQFFSERLFGGLKKENFIGMEADMTSLSSEDFLKPSMECMYEEESDFDYKKISAFQHKQEKGEDFIEWKYRVYEEEKSNSWNSETTSMADTDIRFISNDFYSFDYESDIDSSIDGYSVLELNYDSDLYGFLSENDYGEQELDSKTSINSVNSVNNLESLILEVKDDSDFINEKRKLEEDNRKEKLVSVEENISLRSNSEQNFAENEVIKNPDPHELSSAAMNSRQRLDSLEEALFIKDEAFDETKAKRDLEAVESKQDESKTTNLDSEGLDEEWEHQELIEQLKMELKKARAVGLPTIMENFESTKTIEDLKPFKIDEKFLRENPLNEFQMFYKSYRERMRKFDILNYQKMYAMGKLKAH